MLEDNEEQPQPNTQNQQAPSARRQPNKPKKQKVSVALKAQQFEREKGLKALYEMTKQMNINEQSQINPANTMKKIVVTLKKWQFEMKPQYTFDLFLQRCHALGTNKFLHAYLPKVRRIHKGQDTWSVPTSNEAQIQQNPQPQQREEQQIYNHQRVQEEHKQVMQMMNNFTNTMKEDDEQMNAEDLQLIEMLEATTRKREENTNEKKNVGEESEPYVPEGYDNIPFSQDQY